MENKSKTIVGKTREEGVNENKGGQLSKKRERDELQKNQSIPILRPNDYFIKIAVFFINSHIIYVFFLYNHI